MLGCLDEKEERVKSLVTDKEDVKSRSRKVSFFMVTIIVHPTKIPGTTLHTQIQQHNKKKMSDLKHTLELSQARQVELQTEKESLK